MVDEVAADRVVRAGHERHFSLVPTPSALGQDGIAAASEASRWNKPPNEQQYVREAPRRRMIIENAADPYHVQYVHKAANPATTASFEVSGYHLHATVNANFGGGRAKTWLTPNGPVDAKIIYDNYSLGLGIVRFPSDLVATVQVTGQTPVDEDYTDYFYTQASIRETGDTGDKPTGRADKFLQLQQEVIKQDFFTWENMKYLEKPNLAPEEARDYAALRRWAHRFYPAEEPSSTDFGYTADGDARPGGSESVMPTSGTVGLDAAAFGVERFTVPAVLDRRAEQFGDRVMMSIAGTPVTFAADARAVVRRGQRACGSRGRAGRDRRAVHRHLPGVGVLLAGCRAHRRGARGGQRSEQGRLPAARVAAVPCRGGRHRRRSTGPPRRSGRRGRHTEIAIGSR